MAGCREEGTTKGWWKLRDRGRQGKGIHCSSLPPRLPPQSNQSPARLHPASFTSTQSKSRPIQCSPELQRGVAAWRAPFTIQAVGKERWAKSKEKKAPAQASHPPLSREHTAALPNATTVGCGPKDETLSPPINTCKCGLGIWRRRRHGRQRQAGGQWPWPGGAWPSHIAAGDEGAAHTLRWSFRPLRFLCGTRKFWIFCFPCFVCLMAASPACCNKLFFSPDGL